MTREEAIEKLQKQKAEYLEEWVDYSGVAEAYDMAIEALQNLQPTCNQLVTDLIQRSDAIEAIENIKRTDNWKASVIVTLCDLPSCHSCRECDEEAYERGYTAGQFADRPKGEWIPCSERLPDKNGWYLVTVQGYETLTDVSLYSDDDGCAWGDVSAKQKVIAWMPLPKPYRGEQIDSNT